MAQTKVVARLALVVLTTFWVGATAQSDCTNELISMSRCLNYMTGNISTPPSSCCTQLASVVRSSPQCLCQVLDGGSSSLGIEVNQTRAIALPGQCNVQTPPVSQCNAISPASSPSGTPESSTTPTGTSSKTTPSIDTNNTSRRKLRQAVNLFLPPPFCSNLWFSLLSILISTSRSPSTCPVFLYLVH